MIFATIGLHSFDINSSLPSCDQQLVSVWLLHQISIVHVFLCNTMDSMMCYVLTLPDSKCQGIILIVWNDLGVA